MFPGRQERRNMMMFVVAIVVEEKNPNNFFHCQLIKNNFVIKKEKFKV